MHTLAFPDLAALTVVYKALNSADAVAFQDDEGVWQLGVPNDLAAQADALAQSPPEVDLGKLKTALKASIDAEAEHQRLRYITPGAGQAMTYARKVEQAKAALAATDPQPEHYPMLAASIGIDGADIAAVATTVIAMDAAWEQIGAAIEMARLAGKRAIDLAESAEAARAVVVVWPEA